MVALAVSERLSVDELREAARSEHRGKVRARLLAMAHLLEGGERGVTARQFGMSRNVLRIWVSRYNTAGIAGLVDRHGGGGPGRGARGEAPRPEKAGVVRARPGRRSVFAHTPPRTAPLG